MHKKSYHLTQLFKSPYYCTLVQDTRILVKISIFRWHLICTHYNGSTPVIKRQFTCLVHTQGKSKTSKCTQTSVYVNWTMYIFSWYKHVHYKIKLFTSSNLYALLKNYHYCNTIINYKHWMLHEPLDTKFWINCVA